MRSSGSAVSARSSDSPADWDLWLRGVLAGYSIVGTHRRLVRYRRHREMTTRHTEVNLTRYRDEIAIPSWVADAAYEAGLADSDEPDYDIAINTLLSQFATLLSRGNREDARALLRFAQENIPGFTDTLKGKIARAAFGWGRLGGLVLRAVETIYIRMPQARG